MASNTLSARRERIPRPAVCKAPNPNHCRPGEIKLRTASLESNGGGSWSLEATWVVRPDLPQLFGKTDNSTTAGSVNQQPSVASGEPFNVEVQQFEPGDKLLVFVVVKTADNCQYLGTGKAVAPPFSQD